MSCDPWLEDHVMLCDPWFENSVVSYGLVVGAGKCVVELADQEVVCCEVSI